MAKVIITNSKSERYQSIGTTASQDNRDGVDGNWSTDSFWVWVKLTHGRNIEYCMIARHGLQQI
jgi:hypothetical protein